MIDRPKKIAGRFYATAGGGRQAAGGYEKKTQKTPQHDIELALKRKQEIER
jgi:hypothetical protein